MEIKSSGIFEKVVIQMEIASKRASKVCIAQGVVKASGTLMTILLKMYRKDMVVNHSHVWNERRVLEHIRDSKTLTDDEKSALPLIYDSLVVQEKDSGNVYICIALKYVRGRTLDKYLDSECMTLSMLKKILMQVAKGIGSLHKEGIMHRDIKCSNIIVESESEKAVLIDMSLACFVDVESKQRLSELCGSFHTMAPEMICVDEPNYGLGFDWWSFGVLVYEMVYGYVEMNAQISLFNIRAFSNWADITKHLGSPSFLEFRIPPYGYHPEENRYLLKRISESPKSLNFPEPVIKIGGLISSKTSLKETESLVSKLLTSNEYDRLGSNGGFSQVIGHSWFGDRME